MSRSFPLPDQLPIAADEIHVNWRTAEGGVGAVGCTDSAGLPYIGLTPLNFDGKPTGWPLNFQRSRIMGNAVAGYRADIPFIVFVDAWVDARGLSLRIRLPDYISHYGDTRQLFAPWGSEPPTYRLMGYPDRADRWWNTLDSNQPLDRFGT